ncbi:MAG: hypothetical protein NTV86_17635 [Planctomycetota bacterium]|nr:hypothetical protein [Planctomycetota bacterium]
MRDYSQFFATLYDESCPVGSIGRGTHYSVLRTLAWFSLEKNIPLDSPLIHDWAVIWDEDHDVRVIEAAERLLQRNLLYPVMFIGERKAFFNVVLFPDFKGDVDMYTAGVTAVAESLDDPWEPFVEVWGGRSPHSMISCTETKAVTYLENIRNLWELGHKPFQAEQENCPPLFPPDLPIVDPYPKGFDLAMMDIYRRAHSEAKYNAARFHQMLLQHGGLETARLLLHAGTVSDGYTALWERKRLDLTVEALVLRPEWEALFSESERSIAKKRLKEYGYDFDSNRTR